MKVKENTDLGDMELALEGNQTDLKVIKWVDMLIA